MSITGVLIVFASICIIWFVVASLLIYDNLRRRGRPVSFLWLRLMLFSYVSQYKEITKAEDGRVGHLFYHWIISINTALLLVVVTIIVSH